MVPPLLIDPAFWESDENWGAEAFPRIPELKGHVFFRTSGSTGEAKWIALSKAALLLSAAAVNRHLEVTEESIWGLPLPIHHVGGFGVVARSHEAACRLSEFSAKWDPHAFTRWLEKTHVTHTSLVPTQVHDLVKAGLQAPPSLIAIVVGGGKLDEATGQSARDQGWPVLASYGMTEACSQIATQTLESLKTPYQPAPIPILPIWNARLTGTDNLEISGPALFSGMVKNGIYHPRLSEWHKTSDRVLLENSAISPLGRADFTVKILGELVNPEEVAAEIMAISGGALHSKNFAVVPISEARAGHVLIPVIESPMSGAEIGIFLSQYNASAVGYRRVGKPVSISEFPRTELGKLRLKELAQWVAKEFLD